VFNDRLLNVNGAHVHQVNLCAGNSHASVQHMTDILHC